MVDDEVKITRVIRAYLEKEGFSVTEAHDGQTALDLAASGEFSLMVLDLMLPRLAGEEVAKRLRMAGQQLPIIMLTAKDGEEDKIIGLGLGADDFIVKPFSPRELVARVHAVLRRFRPSKGSILADVWEYGSGRLTIDTLRHHVAVLGTPITLTATEYKLLVTLARHPGRVFSRGELLEAISGELSTGFDRAVDSHIKNLRHKVELQPDQPVFIKTCLLYTSPSPRDS